MKLAIGGSAVSQWFEYPHGPRGAVVHTDNPYTPQLGSGSAIVKSLRELSTTSTKEKE